MSSKMIAPIGFIENDFKEKFGIPRQSGRINNISYVYFYPPYNSPDAFRELKNFSHVWLIFGFSDIPEKEFSPLVRPPRLGGNEKVGVFASRSPFRPNGLGLSCVELVSVDLQPEKGVVLTVKGADILDGSPIYDIKPYLKKYDCKENALSGYTETYEDKKLKVAYINGAEKNMPAEKLKTLTECLEDDPRPAYQDDGKVYGFNFAGYEIKFSVSGDILTVFDIKIAK